MPSSREIDSDEQGAREAGLAAAAGEPGPQPPSAAPQGGLALPVAGEDEQNGAAELAEIEERYRRALADLDNYRKRSTRETDRRVAEAKDALMRDWLEAVDSVERAVQMEPEGPSREGLRAVLAQMDAVLARNGVQRIGARGEAFDPQRHEAIATASAPEAPDQTVLDVQRSGFSRGEHVIRPAQVVVARPGERAP